MKNIAVVGGGTSGLIAALILKTRFKEIKIDIIKSDRIGAIGVGEGSTEHWLNFCNYVGITLQELLDETGATLKYGVYFKGWTKEDYVHFVNEDWSMEHGNYYPLYGLAIAKKLKNKNIAGNFIFKNKIPEDSHTNQFHFNTFRLNDFLIKKCKEKNINIIEDEILKVEHSEKIEHLIGRKKKYKYDFYIDSTGFKKLLISSLGAKWVSYNKYLPMNEAIAFPTPDTGDYDAYTLAEAMSSGWRWRTPTQDRWGNGYVFCNDFISASQAEEEISKKFNHKIKIAANIKFDTGELDRSWIKNCCAIGLSSSFLEPLEATSIGTTIQQIFLLTNYISSFNDKDIDQFNKYNSDITNNSLDFVLLHYLCKKSDSKFWKHIKNNIKLTDTLSENLEKWRHQLPRKTNDFITPYTLFGPRNYILLLNALNLFDTGSIKKEYIKEMGTKNKIISNKLDNLINMKYTTISHKEMIANKLISYKKMIAKNKRVNVFKNKKYLVVKNAIPKELAIFIYNYFLMKRNVADILFKEKYISPFESMFGTWNDDQVPETYSHYADMAMETLLLMLNDLMNKKTKLNLYPTYSYARIYKKGDELKRHKDRFSCEISTTMNLGGDAWPIYLEPSGGTGKKGKKIILNPGDMLIYKGMELEHWREPFEGVDCAQVFLHYNNSKTDGSDKNIYDNRETLGLPAWFKKK